MDSCLRSSSFILMYGVSYGIVLFLLSVGLVLTLDLIGAHTGAHFAPSVGSV